eukprot:scaffold5087_cov430-Prasinococcus_capsulatus_cf.AAC.1
MTTNGCVPTQQRAATRWPAKDRVRGTYPLGAGLQVALRLLDTVSVVLVGLVVGGVVGRLGHGDGPKASVPTDWQTPLRTYRMGVPCSARPAH